MMGNIWTISMFYWKYNDNIRVSQKLTVDVKQDFSF